RREIMSLVAPSGPVYQAGTLSGNPVAMAAGLAQLNLLRTHPEIYQKLDELGNRLRAGLKKALPHCTVNGVGSLSCVFFTEHPVTDYATARASDTDAFRRYFAHMLENGVYLAPSQFEAMFLSYAHTEGDIDRLIGLAEAL
ncbi:MAG TPA: aspartate aminotransferase family protein, partial [Ruminococcaceae bacterium]|nr:aspartate aminotransferase family protein [Oscillospiraceae bacterium]